MLAPSNPRRHLASFFLFLIAGAICNGCTAVGALIYKANGPAKVDAKYVLPKEPTLILVENRANPSAGQFDADEITHAVGDELKENEAATVIDTDKISALCDADPDKYREMSITALAKAVSAKQVIYVNLIESGVETDPSHLSIHGKATARIRVINAVTGQTAWPLDAMAGGYELNIEIPYTSDTDPSTMANMHTAMITSLSGSIAKLFYDWRPDTTREGDAAE